MGGLVTGSALLVRETRLAFAILREETDFVVEGLHLGGWKGYISTAVRAGRALLDFRAADVATAITSFRAARTACRVGRPGGTSCTIPRGLPM